MQIVVDGLMTAYSRTGKGKLVLVLPGWADVAANWQAFATELSKEFEVVVLDMPGFGGSQAPDGAWDLADYTEFISAFCAKLGVQPECIVGHSNGGAMAIRGLASGDLSVKKLVLLASAGVRGEAKGRGRLLNAVAKTGKVVTAPLPASARKKLRGKLYEAAGSDLLVAEHMQETFKKIVADDVRDDAAKLTVPTLLVYGDHDTATPVAFGQKLNQAIKGSRLEIMPGADHFLYRTHQAEVLQLAISFMKASDVR